jgi:hypothetical protein
MPNDTPIPLADPVVPAEPPHPPADPRLAEALERARRILSGDIRPEDYLPVTAEVRRLTDREMDWARERAVAAGYAELDPCVERRQLRDNILRVHCQKQHVAYIEDDAGIVVVITGLDEIGEMLRRLPGELWSERIKLDYPNDDIMLL